MKNDLPSPNTYMGVVEVIRADGLLERLTDTEAVAVVVGFCIRTGRTALLLMSVSMLITGFVLGLIVGGML